MSFRPNETAANDNLIALLSGLGGGVIEFRTGPMPENPNASAEGSVLASITLPTPAFSAPSGGTAGISGSWTTTVTTTGTVGHARLQSGDVVIYMSVGNQNDTARDLILSGTTNGVTLGETISFTTFGITVENFVSEGG